MVVILIFILILALAQLAIAYWVIKVAVTDAIVNATTKLMQAGFDFPIRDDA